MTYIYGLVDPRTDRVRYVGKTVNPAQRFSKHLRDKQNPHKSNWIAELRRAGQLPRMVILDEVPDHIADDAERAYISFGLLSSPDVRAKHLIGARKGGKVTTASGGGFARLAQEFNHIPVGCPRCERVCGNRGALGHHLKACNGHLTDTVITMTMRGGS